MFFEATVVLRLRYEDVTFCAVLLRRGTPRPLHDASERKEDFVVPCLCESRLPRAERRG